MMAISNPVDFFRSIGSVRETTGPVYQLIKEKCEGNYYKLDESKMNKVAEYLCGIISRDYGDKYDSIPPHGRWQHLNAGGHLRVEQLIEHWRATKVDEIEISRKLVDLLVISVLVDAGAGNLWKYSVDDGSESYSRSEGLAVASYYLFTDGKFSYDSGNKYKVNGQRLKEFTMDQFVTGFQVSEGNPLSGVEGRLQLIRKLGESLLTHQEIFGPDARPGGIVDFLGSKADNNKVDLNDIWKALMDGFVIIWPQGRATIHGQPLGDTWSLDTRLSTKPVWHDEFLDSLVTFHKLTQWLCYSILVPLEKYGHKFQIFNKELQTGLPEYRNGGLFYDFGVIELKPEHLKRGLALSKELGSRDHIPTFVAEDGAIVEWRCLTIGLLDNLHELVNKRLGTNLTLPQVIEAGSWKAGREIAAEKRPQTRGPPIELHSDGTVF